MLPEFCVSLQLLICSTNKDTMVISFIYTRLNVFTMKQENVIILLLRAVGGSGLNYNKAGRISLGLKIKCFFTAIFQLPLLRFIHRRGLACNNMGKQCTSVSLKPSWDLVFCCLFLIFHYR